MLTFAIVLVSLVVLWMLIATIFQPTEPIDEPFEADGEAGLYDADTNHWSNRPYIRH